MRKVCHTRREALWEITYLVGVLRELCDGVPDAEEEKRLLQGMYGALEDYEQASHRDRQVLLGR